MAGLLGNIIYAAAIPMTSILAWAYFEEKLDAMEMGGATLIFGAIFVIMTGKLVKERGDEGSAGEEAAVGEATAAVEVEKFPLLPSRE